MEALLLILGGPEDLARTYRNLTHQQAWEGRLGVNFLASQVQDRPTSETLRFILKRELKVTLSHCHHYGVYSIGDYSPLFNNPNRNLLEFLGGINFISRGDQRLLKFSEVLGVIHGPIPQPLYRPYYPWGIG